MTECGLGGEFDKVGFWVSYSVCVLCIELKDDVFTTLIIVSFQPLEKLELFFKILKSFDCLVSENKDV